MPFYFNLLCFFLVFSFLLRTSLTQELGNELSSPKTNASPFSTALETLQKQIGYDFQTVDLLRRAMTHSSYSNENNRALSILGLDVIQTSISLHYLQRNLDASAKDLSRRISEMSGGDSCASDGYRLGLQNVVRVSTKTNSSTESVVCGAFRAIFGAAAIDSSSADDAGNVFWKFQGGDAEVSAF
ncbi:protein NUCLEAR FUSION DEFECTIVE 2-like [Tasmannia lanceolata]|uniref:protein NUCLEAR FUSION DEFECTIVE 2-like n=1 Tax=Tasmannia lanceolata TaxID=3420 RepID=UPI004063B853